MAKMNEINQIEYLATIVLRPQFGHEISKVSWSKQPSIDRVNLNARKPWDPFTTHSDFFLREATDSQVFP